jgi:hypothetical protein
VSIPTLGSTHTTVQWVQWTFFPGLNRPIRSADHSSQSTRSYISTHSYAFTFAQEQTYRLIGPRNDYKPIPVAERAKAYACSRSLAGIARPNPGGGMDVCCECCVLSGRGICHGESHRACLCLPSTSTSTETEFTLRRRKTNDYSVIDRGQCKINFMKDTTGKKLKCCIRVNRKRRKARNESEKRNFTSTKGWVGMAQSVKQLATGREIFRTRPDRPWGPPSLLHSGYRSYQGERGWGVAFTTYPNLAPRLKKG